MPPLETLTYEVTAENYHRLFWRQIRASRAFYVWPILFFYVASLIYPTFRLKPGVFLLGGGLSLLCFFAYLAANYFQVRWHGRKGMELDPSWTLTVSEEGVEIDSGRMALRFPWSQILRVDEGEKSTFVWDEKSIL